METIRTTSLSKHFGPLKAVDDMSVHVQQGEIYGCLGLNGAGKTTLIRMLLGMIRPNAGKAFLLGKQLTRNFDLWNQVGYLVETPRAYPNLSVAENLHVYYTLRQLDRPALVDEIIEKLKLAKYRHTKAKHLSLGNQQRLGLAKALMHQPRLLFLDEPVNGLDPEGIVEVRELLLGMAAAGASIFLSSHLLGEVSKLAHRIGIIHDGRLIEELPVEELDSRLIKKVRVKTLDNPKALEILQREHYEAALHPENGIELTGAAAIAHPEMITALLAQEGLPPAQVLVNTEDLETYFLRSVQKSRQP